MASMRQQTQTRIPQAAAHRGTHGPHYSTNSQLESVPQDDSAEESSSASDCVVASGGAEGWEIGGAGSVDADELLCRADSSPSRPDRLMAWRRLP